MNQVLLDSSVWIEYFRNSNSQFSSEVDKLIDLGNINTNELILTELIPFLKLKKQLQFLPIFKLPNKKLCDTFQVKQRKVK
ncbi:PIN domain-containing protein [Leptospira kanakyensis]|uniref:hypothetical protein n=1 Tax=Leptospira kanakyensis TaxID=2484968 RepID=UPI001FEDB546|nr:hypothetical protein [Leptospira kanakyensis]MCW7470987.1 hypothetical protein [Leptospira kanakyensis]MCW7483097.1 hypothetical protein [Leptospira kanakyensis]